MYIYVCICQVFLFAGSTWRKRVNHSTPSTVNPRCGRHGIRVRVRVRVRVGFMVRVKVKVRVGVRIRVGVRVRVRIRIKS